MLKEGFKNAINQQAELKELIKQHNNLISLSDDLKDLFSIYGLIFVAQSSLVISLMCFQLAFTGQFAMLIPFLLTTLNQVWLMCYFGQKLSDSSMKICDGLLESNWYALEDPEKKRSISFIIHRSQKPNVIKARGFAVITLGTFMGVSFFFCFNNYKKIIKKCFQIIYSAYSYFTLLYGLFSKSK